MVFWRRHSFSREARDGFRTYFLNERSRKSPKKYCRPIVPSSEALKVLIEEKINRIIAVRHLGSGYVHWDIRFFDVPKGDSDIRIVYNGTDNGINLEVWTPTFYLLTSLSLSRLLEPRTYQMDMDIGEMFPNFVLNRDVRAYCGVNVKGLDLDDATSERHRWDRIWMGFKPSPFNAARYLAIASKYAVGDPLDPKNAFFWDKLILNLPFSDTFNPGMPWLYKLDSRVNRIASDAVTFMDDSRITGHSIEACWQAGRQLASKLQHLGIQDAARKKRPPSLDAQAWAGTIIKTQGMNVEKTV